MPSTLRKTRPSPEILIRHAEMAEIAELHRIAEEWRCEARAVHVVPTPNANCPTDDSFVVVIGRADDVGLLALREAAAAQDKAGVMDAYFRFGERLARAADHAGEIDFAHAAGIADLAYGGRALLRNVVVDHVVGFNMFGFTFAGRIDAQQFSLIEQRIRPDAAPLTAVVLVKEHRPSPLEEEAERVAPSSARRAVISPRIVGDFIDDIVDHVKHAAENVADTAKKAVHVAGCQIQIDVANPNVVAQQGAQQQVDQSVARRVAVATVDDFGPLGARSPHVLSAPAASLDLEGATIDALIDYRARIFSRS